jgi:hypothetical protein
MTTQHEDGGGDLTPRRLLVTDVSEQNFDHVFEGQAVLFESLVLERWD